MSERQNLTVSLKSKTIRKAKRLAARRDTSVSRLVADLIEELVSEDERYETAKRAATEYLNQGFSLGGKIMASREELHER
jgi:hypothetical protein